VSSPTAKEEAALKKAERALRQEHERQERLRSRGLLDEQGNLKAGGGGGPGGVLPGLPDDLVREIFYRLPLETRRGALPLVCSQWASIPRSLRAAGPRGAARSPGLAESWARERERAELERQRQLERRAGGAQHGGGGGGGRWGSSSSSSDGSDDGGGRELPLSPRSLRPLCPPADVLTLVVPLDSSSFGPMPEVVIAEEEREGKGEEEEEEEEESLPQQQQPLLSASAAAAALKLHLPRALVAAPRCEELKITAFADQLEPLAENLAAVASVGGNRGRAAATGATANKEEAAAAAAPSSNSFSSSPPPPLPPLRRRKSGACLAPCLSRVDLSLHPAFVEHRAPARPRGVAAATSAEAAAEAARAAATEAAIEAAIPPETAEQRQRRDVELHRCSGAGLRVRSFF